MFIWCANAEPIHSITIDDVSSTISLTDATANQSTLGTTITDPGNGQTYEFV
jgi:hypothetical protein